MTATSTTTVAQLAAAEPSRVGPWQLLGQIGEGQLCRVYAAKPVTHPADRPADYAVKILCDRWMDNPAAIEVMRREAVVGRKISHPHLISVLSAHVGAAPYFLVMPRLDGSSLAARLAAGDQPCVPTALWFARQTAEALDALHKGAWMHADVKPSNIFISPGGHATLLDLGFARQPADAMSIVDRCVTGTMHYIAPEMLTSALRPDIRSDVYSLGATLYEMLGGRPPFQAPSLEELADLHRQAEPHSLRSLNPLLPAELARLVHQMLAKEPLRRPQTPAEVVQRLVSLEIETFDMR